MANTGRYRVRTWDTEAGNWTPQEGLSVPSDGMTWPELLQSLRELRELGYACDYQQDGECDPAVLVEREEEFETQRTLFV